MTRDEEPLYPSFYLFVRVPCPSSYSTGQPLPGGPGHSVVSELHGISIYRPAFLTLTLTCSMSYLEKLYC